MDSYREKDHGYVYDHFLDAAEHALTSLSWRKILPGIPEQNKG